MQKGNKEKQNTPVLTTKKKKNPKTLLIQGWREARQAEARGAS